MRDNINVLIKTKKIVDKNKILVDNNYDYQKEEKVLKTI